MDYYKEEEGAAMYKRLCDMDDTIDNMSKEEEEATFQDGIHSLADRIQEIDDQTYLRANLFLSIAVRGMAKKDPDAAYALQLANAMLGAIHVGLVDVQVK